MDKTKMPWQSVTVLSALASALVSLLGLSGVTIDAGVANDAVGAAAQLAAALLSALAVWGRLRATTRMRSAVGLAAMRSASDAVSESAGVAPLSARSAWWRT